MSYRFCTPDGRIKSMYDNQVFVFGSNLQGNHAAGAARDAVRCFGAIWGQGEGLQGQSYAIPTMHGGPLQIKPYVDRFITFAKEHQELTFLVTRIGCGIAGLKAIEIAPLFKDALPLDNVRLPRSFAMIILAMELDESHNASLIGNISSFDNFNNGFSRRNVITTDHSCCYTLFRKDGKYTLGQFEEVYDVLHPQGWYSVGGEGIFNEALATHDHYCPYKGYMALKYQSKWLILSVDADTSHALICEDESLDIAKEKLWLITGIYYRDWFNPFDISEEDYDPFSIGYKKW